MCCLHPPADDSLGPEQAIGDPPPQLPVDLQSHPHRGVGPSQGERSVSLPVHDVDVGASGQEEAAGGEKKISITCVTHT